MSTVPYTFATASGNVPLSQLDANFSNVKAFATTAGTVTIGAQPNITSVGTLTSLTVTGNLSAGNISGNFSGSISNAVYATSAGSATTATTATTAGTVTTAAQPNITSVGTLSSLTVTANVTGGNLVTAGLVVGDGSRLSSLAGANVTGTVANATYATTAGSATTATTAGTVTTAAQPNVTSVGTLTSLSVTGNITSSANISGSYILGNGSQLTGIPSGPIFMAYNSANQNLSNGPVILIFGTTTVNTNNYYDTTTGLFTPLQSGYYQINVSFTPEYVSGTANDSFFTGLYKNGSLIAVGPSTTVTPTWGTIGCSSISTLVYLNGSTDYLGIASLNTINSGTWRSGISVVNYFQGTWIHP